MYNKKPMPGTPAMGGNGRVYAGGTPNFNEATGKYSKPATKPAMGAKQPMTKPQARMQAMKKKMGM